MQSEYLQPIMKKIADMSYEKQTQNKPNFETTLQPRVVRGAYTLNE